MSQKSVASYGNLRQVAFLIFGRSVWPLLPKADISDTEQCQFGSRQGGNKFAQIQNFSTIDIGNLRGKMSFVF